MPGWPTGALLVGSVPLDESAEVFRAAGAALRDRLRRVPDGEPAERANWIVFQAGVFDRHPDIELAPRPDDGYGAVLPVYRLRGGVDPANVDLTPLGYADAAVRSYEVFRTLRDAGVLAAETRFQVSLPTPAAVVASFVEPAQQARLEPVYTAALLTELRHIQDTIPAADLAIQWDLAIEPAMWEGVGGIFTPWFAPIREGSLDRVATMLAAVDDDVELGIHLCYGDFEHRHYLEPKDTGVLTELANGLAERAGRPLNWLHLPVPKDRDDAAYFAPLHDLRLPEATEVYLGLVHADDPAGTRRRITTAQEVLPHFGVATECGLGRTPRDQIPALLQQHAEVTAPW